MKFTHLHKIKDVKRTTVGQDQKSKVVTDKVTRIYYQNNSTGLAGRSSSFRIRSFNSKHGNNVKLFIAINN